MSDKQLDCIFIGKNAGMISAVGNDLFGTLVLKELKHFGVDTQGILIIPNGQTVIALIAIERYSGNRSITLADGCFRRS